MSSFPWPCPPGTLPMLLVRLLLLPLPAAFRRPARPSTAVAASSRRTAWCGARRRYWTASECVSAGCRSEGGLGLDVAARGSVQCGSTCHAALVGRCGSVVDVGFIAPAGSNPGHRASSESTACSAYVDTATGRILAASNRFHTTCSYLSVDRMHCRTPFNVHAFPCVPAPQILVHLPAAAP